MANRKRRKKIRTGQRKGNQNRKLQPVIDYFGFTPEDISRIPNQHYGALIKYVALRTTNLARGAHDDTDEEMFYRRYNPLLEKISPKKFQYIN